MTIPSPTDLGVLLYLHGAATDHYYDRNGALQTAAAWAASGVYKDGAGFPVNLGQRRDAVFFVQAAKGGGSPITEVTIKFECRKVDVWNTSLWTAARTPLRSQYLDTDGTVNEAWEHVLTFSSTLVAQFCLGDQYLAGETFLSIKGNGTAASGDKFIVSGEAH